MKKYSLFSLLCVITLSAAPCYAFKLLCHTPNQEYQFLVGKDFLKMIPADWKENSEHNSRKIASLKQTPRVVHSSAQNKWSKMFYHKDMRAKLVIEDTKNPSEVDDYLALVSPQGHKMTYALECSPF